jgi:hypothetical protein
MLKSYLNQLRLNPDYDTLTLLYTYYIKLVIVQKLQTYLNSKQQQQYPISNIPKYMVIHWMIQKEEKEKREIFKKYIIPTEDNLTFKTFDEEMKRLFEENNLSTLTKFIPIQSSEEASNARPVLLPPIITHKSIFSRKEDPDREEIEMNLALLYTILQTPFQQNIINTGQREQQTRFGKLLQKILNLLFDNSYHEYIEKLFNNEELTSLTSLTSLKLLKLLKLKNFYLSLNNVDDNNDRIKKLFSFFKQFKKKYIEELEKFFDNNKTIIYTGIHKYMVVHWMNTTDDDMNVFFVRKFIQSKLTFVTYNSIMVDMYNEDSSLYESFRIQEYLLTYHEYKKNIINKCERVVFKNKEILVKKGYLTEKNNIYSYKDEISITSDGIIKYNSSTSENDKYNAIILLANIIKISQTPLSRRERTSEETIRMLELLLADDTYKYDKTALGNRMKVLKERENQKQMDHPQAKSSRQQGLAVFPSLSKRVSDFASKFKNTIKGADYYPYTSIGGVKIKKINKKVILGKERCIYKKSGDRKEYIKHKGELITVKNYKKLHQQKIK